MPRVGLADIQRARLFCGRRRRGQLSATSGNKWRAHLAPDKTGRWTYRISFVSGKGVALAARRQGRAVAPFDGRSGHLSGRRDRQESAGLSSARPAAVRGQHYLQFAGSGDYFLKLGADSPETLLAYADFDGTDARKPAGAAAHLRAARRRTGRTGDPTWKDGKGKGLIGALNYLASKGVNSISFLPYNAGGDGDNVWPFVARDDKFHYDVSKLDQWQIVFDHAQQKGIYLHFKLQENEIDDNVRGNPDEPATRRSQSGATGPVTESLDGGDLGSERKLYCASWSRASVICSR